MLGRDRNDFIEEPCPGFSFLWGFQLKCVSSQSCDLRRWNRHISSSQQVIQNNSFDREESSSHSCFIAKEQRILRLYAAMELGEDSMLLLYTFFFQKQETIHTSWTNSTEIVMTCHPSRWMQTEIFCPIWLDHFLMSVKPTLNYPKRWKHIDCSTYKKTEENMSYVLKCDICVRIYVPFLDVATSLVSFVYMTCVFRSDSGHLFM
jgi:hypothetical protein